MQFASNHLQPVVRQRQKQHKQRDLQFASMVTYMLWEGKGRNSISKGICNVQSTTTYRLWEGKGRNNIRKGIFSLQAQSLTTCGKAKDKQHRQRDLQFVYKYNHLQAVGSQGRNRISKGICSLQA